MKYFVTITFLCYLVIGTVAWNNLSAQEQQWLQEAADEAKDYQRKLANVVHGQKEASTGEEGKEARIQKTSSETTAGDVD